VFAPCIYLADNVGQAAISFDAVRHVINEDQVLAAE
jgi:hypothetical protein